MDENTNAITPELEAALDAELASTMAVYQEGN